MGCYEYESQAPGANHPPVAVALANGQAGIVVDEASPSGTAVTLDGSQSTDPDRGDVLTYAWDFTTDGPVDAGTAQAQATYAVGGPYTATLTVTDSHGLTSTDSVAVTVVPGEPDNQLDNLGKAITGGVTGGTIAPEIQGSLMAKVTAALTALAQNLPNDAKIAANNLKAFINEVRAQADVSVDIVNVAGRPVRTIWSHRGLLAGVNALLWDGRSAAGTKVPSGVYLVRIAAHGPRGSASHAVTTLRLTR
jgi:PKD repeat protein